MRKIVGSLFVFMLAVSLVLVPSPVLANPGIGDDCTTDQVKWWDNENSRVLYLCNWGRTPVSAMSRLAGLAYPDALCQDVCNATGRCNSTKITGCDLGTESTEGCFGDCCCCRSEEEGCQACCDDPAACPLSGSECYLYCMDDSACFEQAAGCGSTAHCCGCWGKSLCFANKSWAGCDISPHPRWNNEHPNHFGNSAAAAENWGGDWGTSGCPHTECAAQCWCLQDNICQDFAEGCL